MEHIRTEIIRQGRKLSVSAVCALFLILFNTSIWAQEGWGFFGGSSTTPPRDVKVETSMKIKSSFTVAAVGDIIAPRALYSNDPHYTALIDVIRKADVGFGNMESSLVDFKTLVGPVDGTEAPLEMGQSMKAMGITLVNHATNHTFDGGVMGMFSTIQELDRLGIAHAGTGRDLQEARKAGYQETPKGRVGLVGMFSIDDISNYGPNFAKTAATYRNGDLGGAPGANVLHLRAYHIVSPEQLQQLKTISETATGRKPAQFDSSKGEPERFKFFDEWYQAGSNSGAISYEMNPKDEQDILASIKNGKVYSDFLIATIHTHQVTSFKTQGIGGIDHDVADFLVKIAHESIDSGADMFIAHGVHALHGVEIYKGKPIFYGLSNFVFQFGLQFGQGGYDIMANEKGMSVLENPASQETVLTATHFENGSMKEIRLYPVDLGGSRRPISQMGIPMTPSPEDAQRILKEVQEYSKPFGTNITVENNLGVIRVQN